MLERRLRREFEDHAAPEANASTAGTAAFYGRAVQVSCCIEDQVAVGAVAALPGLVEAVQYLLRPLAVRAGR